MKVTCYAFDFCSSNYVLMDNNSLMLLFDSCCELVYVVKKVLRMIFVFDSEDNYFCIGIMDNLGRSLDLTLKRIYTKCDLRYYSIGVEEAKYNIQVLFFSFASFFDLFYICDLLLSQVFDALFVKWTFVVLRDA